MNCVTDNLALVRRRIEDACLGAGRDAREVRLVAVSKRHSAAAVREAMAAGQVEFGESQVQEALPKRAEADPENSAIWHFIGQLQANKTRAIAEHFHWIQSIDRTRTADRLSRQRMASSAIGRLNVCIQIRLDDDPNRAGVASDEAERLAAHIEHLDGLTLRGIMCLPPVARDAAQQRSAFARVREVFDALRAGGHQLDTLSMGMSADLEAAIAEGATLVRVGTSIFGPRDSGGT